MFIYGIEIEFYLGNASFEVIRQYLNQISAEFSLNFIDLKKEDGENQYEIALPPIADKFLLIKLHNQIYNFLIDQECILNTKPFETEPSSSLQISISLKNHDNETFDYMLAGCLERMPEMLKIFNPSEEDKARYIKGTIHTATKLCWGSNNRSVAIRVVKNEEGIKRMEFRTISNSSNLEKCLEIIEESIIYGIHNKTSLPQATFGNANDDQYKLPLILDYL
ncbi:MAG: hypothetical protein J0G32_04800 [Alphaproteobacteria bacterium]|nr:hypothetical protein [Alphaproteobacteria bacterium]OJV14068.1 MAG: hypothetical protein BGO27_01095 [Alphaproteobacteria bacterium 33-17]